jgi:hypothetical protein
LLLCHGSGSVGVGADQRREHQRHHKSGEATPIMAAWPRSSRDRARPCHLRLPPRPWCEQGPSCDAHSGCARLDTRIVTPKIHAKHRRHDQAKAAVTMTSTAN